MASPEDICIKTIGKPFPKSVLESAAEYRDASAIQNPQKKKVAEASARLIYIAVNAEQQRLEVDIEVPVIIREYRVSRGQVAITRYESAVDDPTERLRERFILDALPNTAPETNKPGSLKKRSIVLNPTNGKSSYRNQ